MNESSYTDIANNLTSYLEKYCGIEKSNENVTVDEMLTDLIHMDKPSNNQEGGVMIEEVMTNLTGGDAQGGKNKQTKDKVEFVIKPLDTNLLEGGDNGDDSDSSYSEYSSDSDSDSDYSIGEGSSDDDSFDFNSDDEANSYGNAVPISKTSSKSSYAEFLKHYADKDMHTRVRGGDNAEKKSEKIQIIPMFPYLLRY